jgi:uncharacterized protein DUF4129
VRPKTNNRRLWLTAGLLLAFVLLSGALRQYTLAPGLRIATTAADTIDLAFAAQERTTTPLGGDAAGLVVSITAGLSIVLFIVAIIRKETRASLLFAMLIGAALAALLSGLVRPLDEDDPLVFGDPLADNSESAVGAIDLLDPEDAVDEDPETAPVPWFWSIAVVGTALAGMFVVLRPFRRRTREPQGDDLGQVASGAADAIEAGESLQDVIQRCYRDMITTLEETRSVRRRESMTPREFEDRLLREGVAAPDIRGLTRLFELSRYAANATTKADEVLAIEHLRRIAKALGGEA